MNLRPGWRHLAPWFVPASLLLLWQLASSAFYSSSLVLPAPTAVASTLWELAVSGELWAHSWASIVRLSLGGMLGVGTGIVAGLIAGRNATIAALARPLVGFFSGISGVAWIPIAFVWFGTGTVMTTFILWNAVFFIVFVNTAQGVTQVHPIYENAIRTMGGGRLRVMAGAVIPGALPSILTGTRVAMGFAWRSLIAAEMLGATLGLGQLIFSAMPWQRTDTMLAGAITIGVLGTLFDRYVLEVIERRTVQRWGMVSAVGLQAGA